MKAGGRNTAPGTLLIRCFICPEILRGPGQSPGQKPVTPDAHHKVIAPATKLRDFGPIADIPPRG